VYRIRLPALSDVPQIAERLAQHPQVATAEPNYVHSLGVPQSPIASGIEAQPRVRRAGTEQPVLAILDSGVLDLPELSGLVVDRYNAVDPEREPTDPVGHGTQMALIAGGAVLPQGAAYGDVGEGVGLLAIRTFDDNGRASNFSLGRAIEYAVAEGAQVLNMSWGADHDSSVLRGAVAYAQSQAMVLVAAAGNRPDGEPVYPAGYDGVVAVSALNSDGSVWENSNLGEFVAVAAPGTAVFPVGHEGPPGAYAGTSVASAFVARSLVLYLQRTPGAGPEEAVEALYRTLTDRGEPGRDPVYGYGALDAAAMERFLGE
jgi:hypothetical protein